MRRHKVIVLLLVTVCVHVVVLGHAFAENESDDEAGIKLSDWDVEAGATIDWYTKYIWRGQNLADDGVFQPSGYVSIAEFTASFWGNYMMTDTKVWTERDYGLDYSKSLGFIEPEFEKVSVSFGYIYYEFPNLPSGEDSQEVYGAVAVDTFLSPSLAVYHDYDEGDGTYYEGSVGHSLPVIDPLTLNLSASIGYNDGQWDYDSSFSSALLGASVTFPLSDMLSFEPGIFYSVALDSQYDDEFYGGFSLSIDL